jgi:hypothetical protein
MQEETKWYRITSLKKHVCKNWENAQELGEVHTAREAILRASIWNCVWNFEKCHAAYNSVRVGK